MENHDSTAGLIMIAIGALLLIAIAFASTAASAILYLAALIACIFFGVTFVAVGSLRLRRVTMSNQPNTQSMPVSALAQVVLQMVSEGSGQEEIAKKTGVSPSVVAEKWAALTSAGYLADGHLTERGFETLRNIRARPA